VGNGTVAKLILEWRESGGPTVRALPEVAQPAKIQGIQSAFPRAQSDHAAGQCKARGGGHVFERAGTFSNRPLGTAFWYENSNGLVEIAVNQGRANRERRSRDWQSGRDFH
jgi:hypothetical protein